MANASLGSLVDRLLYYQPAKERSAYLDDVRSSNYSDTDDEDDRPSRLDRRPDLKKRTANELRVSKTDPGATLLRRKDAQLFLSHKVHIAVDGGQDRIITPVTTTTSTILRSQVVGFSLTDT